MNSSSSCYIFVASVGSVFFNAATATFLLSSSQCTNAPKSFLFTKVNRFWLRLEAIPILWQERACPSKLDFRLQLFFFSTHQLRLLNVLFWHFSLNIFSSSCSGVLKNLWCFFFPKDDTPTASSLNHFFGSGQLVFFW